MSIHSDIKRIIDLLEAVNPPTESKFPEVRLQFFQDKELHCHAMANTFHNSNFMCFADASTYEEAICRLLRAVESKVAAHHDEIVQANGRLFTALNAKQDVTQPEIKEKARSTFFKLDEHEKTLIKRFRERSVGPTEITDEYTRRFIFLAEKKLIQHHDLTGWRLTTLGEVVSQLLVETKSDS